MLCVNFCIVYVGYRKQCSIIRQYVKLTFFINCHFESNNYLCLWKEFDNLSELKKMSEIGNLSELGKLAFIVGLSALFSTISTYSGSTFLHFENWCFHEQQLHMIRTGNYNLLQCSPLQCLSLRTIYLTQFVVPQTQIWGPI